jgi:hypothetical protein
MVRQVGEPYNQLFVLANNSPNFIIHATLASAMPWDEAQEESDAKTSLMIANALFLAVIQAQNQLFSLNLDNDLEVCKADLINAQAQELRNKV